ncbi:MAG: GAF domain-containing protein, partial [Gemmatimonadetes bacterium]|nr:GAF domain-containing protein [Gemmatimonadota bacterium]NIW66585.1 GAF domain-containing protein [Gemmatimonadota bacterium]
MPFRARPGPPPNLSRLRRALETVRTSHRALLQATEEEALLQEITRVAVEVGGYRFAWIGYAEDGPGFPVRPVAWAGEERGYLEEIRVSWGEDPTGRGPVGGAIRSGTTVTVRDTATDPRFSPWREPALQRDYWAVIAVPLLNSEGAFGALAVYAAE